MSGDESVMRGVRLSHEQGQPDPFGDFAIQTDRVTEPVGREGSHRETGMSADASESASEELRSRNRSESGRQLLARDSALVPPRNPQGTHEIPRAGPHERFDVDVASSCDARACDAPLSRQGERWYALLSRAHASSPPHALPSQHCADRLPMPLLVAGDGDGERGLPQRLAREKCQRRSKLQVANRTYTPSAHRRFFPSPQQDAHAFP